ncbi:MAG TPA: cbb3-type cytochrome oxidase assembly protein CcoS [Wenzhouxiangella sp.]|nr:cbb3-type cytochrome oxidase assembly protein CcoS [Wenzhouxiangella sp.]
MTIIYVLIPLSIVMMIIAVGAFFWAVRSGQFDDLDTPALDILDDDEYPKERKPNSNSDDRPGQGRDTP